MQAFFFVETLAGSQLRHVRVGGGQGGLALSWAEQEMARGPIAVDKLYRIYYI